MRSVIKGGARSVSVFAILLGHLFGEDQFGASGISVALLPRVGLTP